MSLCKRMRKIKICTELVCYEYFLMFEVIDVLLTNTNIKLTIHERHMKLTEQNLK